MRRFGLMGLCCMVACFSESEPEMNSGSAGTDDASSTAGSSSSGGDADTTGSSLDETGWSTGLSLTSSSSGSTGELGGICEERITLLFDANSVEAELNDLTFPVRFGLDEFDYANYSMEDITVLDAEEEPIPHRVDTWRTGGESVLWVRAPRIDTAHDRIFVCSGSAPQNPLPDVWLQEVIGVWNFSDPDDTGAVPDESLYAHTAVIGATPDPDPAPRQSPLGEALAFQQPGDFAQVTNSKDLTPPGSMTMEAVVRKTNAESDWQTVIQKSEGYNLRVTDGLGQSGAEVFFSEVSSISTRVDAIPEDDYVYLAAIYDQAAGELRFCVNGDACATTQAPVTGPFANKNPLQLGRGDVEIDHLRITAAARSPEWIEAVARGFAGTLLLPL